jgi:hypothetical protein
MAIRMSEFDLKRIMSARKAGNGPTTPSAKRKPSVNKAAPSPAAPKKGRLQRIAYEGEEVTIMIQMPPRPKERARTFVDMAATTPRLITAFKSANGDVENKMPWPQPRACQMPMQTPSSGTAATCDIGFISPQDC